MMDLFKYKVKINFITYTPEHKLPYILINTVSFCWQMKYCIAQNSGGGKLWQISHFRVFVRKTLVNSKFKSLANYGVSGSGI